MHSSPPSAKRGFVARAIDAYNPGITMLVVVWSVGFALRSWLGARGLLSPLVDDALRSLLYVVPIMLVGWAGLAIADRAFKLGLFPRDSRD